MDSLPDDAVQYILSKLSHAKDVASCNCVSKSWKHLTRYRNSLCFHDGIFNNLTPPQTPESIVMQMVSSVSRLEHLLVSFRTSIEGPASWLLVVGSSLKNLELRVDRRPTEARMILECINQAARNLEYLKLWRVAMTRTPKLDVFPKLRVLKISQVVTEDTVLMEALRATPHLTRLVVVACKGLSSVRIELLELRHCQLHTSHTADCSVTLRTPKLQHLKLRGWASIRVHDTNCLKTFSINDPSCVAPMVELGDNLMGLKSLSVKGYKWHWEVITKMLQLATQVKHLSLDTGFTIEGLASWLSVVGSSLKNLELRVAHAPTKARMILECINQAARNLEYLKLWRVLMTRTPKLNVFRKLRSLKICEVVMEDSVLMEALRVTPRLTRLVLVDCKGLSSVRIELLELRHCQLDTCLTSGCSITLRAPKLQHLKLSGWAWIRVHDMNCLKTFSISNVSCPMVELGDNVMALESLSVKAYEWHLEVITKMLQLATQVKHLSLDMGITPGSLFPETDFLDLFKTHPKLEFLRIRDGMIDALCNNHITTTTPLKNSLVIPCLEEVVISLALRSNAEKVTWVVESLLKYGNNKLKKITMIVKACLWDDDLDEFCDQIPRLFQDSTTVCHVVRDFHVEV